VTTTTRKTLQFGVEVGTVGLSRMELVYVIAPAIGGMTWLDSDEYDNWTIRHSTDRVWGVVRDSSLGSAENSGRIVSPILDLDDLELLYRIADALALAGVQPVFTAYRWDSVRCKSTGTMVWQ